VATDTARTTEKSYWEKSRKGKMKQVMFKMLLVQNNNTLIKLY